MEAGVKQSPSPIFLWLAHPLKRLPRPDRPTAPHPEVPEGPVARHRQALLPWIHITISRVLWRTERPFSLLPEHCNFAGIAINADANAVRDAFGCLTRPNNSRNTVFTRDDRSM